MIGGDHEHLIDRVLRYTRPKPKGEREVLLAYARELEAYAAEIRKTNGARQCRACKNDWDRRYRAKKKVAA